MALLSVFLLYILFQTQQTSTMPQGAMGEATVPFTFFYIIPTSGESFKKNKKECRQFCMYTTSARILVFAIRLRRRKKKDGTAFITCRSIYFTCNNVSGEKPQKKQLVLLNLTLNDELQIHGRNI